MIAAAISQVIHHTITILGGVAETKGGRIIGTCQEQGCSDPQVSPVTRDYHVHVHDGRIECTSG